ncbi:unnamed protein product [Phytophthora fragariaefolia]|uniref:Unnamed protein product n=1 Tax=Phytophthora fragariaefolia TaxID=1490495 RepID=A0A9W6XM01_9STRA|nr:unnamed protein product [Phytophthora fragariaefolia]
MLDVDPEKNLHLRYLLAAELDNDERGEGEPGRHDDVYERVPNSLALEDYAHELAFLPDLNDVVPTRLDYSADNVVCSAHSAEQISRLVEMHRARERTMVSITPVVELDETLKQLSPLSRGSDRVWIDPQLLYAAVPPGYHDHVLSFHGSATATKNGGYDSCSWIIWRLPSWDIEIAASAHLPSTTVNIAQYTGMNNGVVAALQRGVSNLILVGDSRLAIQQSIGVTVCKKGTLQVELAKHKELTKNLNFVRYLHVVRLYNSVADPMATEALEAKAGWVVLTLERKAELKALNKIPEVLYVSGNSADAPEEPNVTGATHGRARRFHVGNDERENTVSEAIVEHVEELFKGPSRPPTRQSTTRNEAEFGRSQPRALEGIAQLPAEFGEASTLDANDTNPLVAQAERRQWRSKAPDGKLEWVDLKAYLEEEVIQLTHSRVHNAGADVAKQAQSSEDCRSSTNKTHLKDARLAGAVPVQVTTTELSRADSARQQVEADLADNCSRVEEVRLDGALSFRFTTTELSRVDSVEGNSAMVVAKENSAELWDWSCGASVATCGTREAWSHKNYLSHNWSGGASVAPYGTSKAWWRKQNLSHRELRVGDDAVPRQPPEKCPEHRRSPAERPRSSRTDGKTNTESTKTRDTSILTAQLLEAGGAINSAVARTE